MTCVQFFSLKITPSYCKTVLESFEESVGVDRVSKETVHDNYLPSKDNIISDKIPM